MSEPTTLPMKPADEEEQFHCREAINRAKHAERVTFLDEGCAVEKELRAGLQALIEGHAGHNPVLELPVAPAGSISEATTAIGPKCSAWLLVTILLMVWMGTRPRLRSLLQAVLSRTEPCGSALFFCLQIAADLGQLRPRRSKSAGPVAQ